MNKEYFKTAEAAEFLRVSMSKLWKMCSKKELSYYKMGRLNLFKKCDLENLIEKNRVLTIHDLKKQADDILCTVRQKTDGKN